MLAAVAATGAAVVMVAVLVVVMTGLLKATVTVLVAVVLVVVVELDVDDVGWWPTAQLVDAATFEGHVSSARELILRCEPLQLLPQDIFTEQLILS